MMAVPTNKQRRAKRRSAMLDFLLGALISVGRVINFILDLVLTYTRLKRVAVYFTGADRIVKVPPDPKELPPAARRALAEAEARNGV